MTHTKQNAPGGSVNTDEQISDYIFTQAIVDNQDIFDFEKEQMELFGFID